MAFFIYLRPPPPPPEDPLLDPPPPEDEEEDEDLALELEPTLELELDEGAEYDEELFDDDEEDELLLELLDDGVEYVLDELLPDPLRVTVGVEEVEDLVEPVLVAVLRLEDVVVERVDDWLVVTEDLVDDVPDPERV